jgi:hypothetical protein
MAKKAAAKSSEVGSARCADRTPQRGVPTKLKPSALLDTRVVYCGDNLEQLAKLPDACNSAFRTPHSAFRTPHSAFRIPHSAFAMAGSFYYHCDWHASHYVKVMLDQIFGGNNFTN